MMHVSPSQPRCARNRRPSSHTVPLRRTLRGIAACCAIGSSRAHAQATPAASHGAIFVRVADANDQPLWGGDIDLPVLDVHFPVPDGGNLLLKDVPPGVYLIQAKRIGYAVQRRLVKVGTDTTRVQFTMVSGTMLDTVKVTAYNDTWVTDFERHKKAGFGTFYNAADIANAHAERLSTFMNRARGVVISVGEPDVVHSVRASGRCGMMQIYVDGMLMNAPESTPGNLTAQSRPRDGFGNASAFDINSIPLTTIGAIEVYTNTASIPALYRSSRDECGVLLIWTK